MAALADISGAGRQIVQEVADALKQEGLLEPETKFENIDQLLDGLEQTAGRAADVFNAPPLDVAGLRQEWEAFRTSARKIPPRNLPSAELVRRHWDELKQEAARQNRSVFAVSSLVALAVVSDAPENLMRLARAANRAVWRTGQIAGWWIAGSLQQDAPGDPPAGLRDVLGRAVPSVHARGGGPVLATPPVDDRSVVAIGL